MKFKCADQTIEKQETSSVNESYLDELAEHKKKKFLQLVERFARLRDLQYDHDQTEGILKIAVKIVARNLPSNLLRAATILVDYVHGFPPDWSSFWKPEWVGATKLLPEDRRGSLICSGFKEISSVEIGDAVVLTNDISSKGLFAGMAGIVREILSENEEDGTPELLLVEFGEPEESLTQEIEVPLSILRTPRPGDLLENFRR
jgi:hypothetical protein